MNEQQLEVASSIMAKLKGLGVGLIKPKGVIDGPVITGYRFELPMHIALKKVEGAARDLQLAIGSKEPVSIELHGSEIVIYVPNSERKNVDFKEMLWWFLKDEEVGKMALPIMLGVDPTGKKTAIDLAGLPHLLIAGSTGSGKSVFESNLLASLAVAKKPQEELQLYVVDTKRVDLTLFSELPHVNMTVRDIKQWYPMIKHIKKEIDHRLKILESASVRNIKEYNNISSDKLPYVVVIIDEMADLFGRDETHRAERKRIEKQAAEDGNPIEKFSEPEPLDAIKECVAIARAAGVHFISCTQRTSVDVINGVVKNNFPARISLRVPTSHDSKTILGNGGAESLLGKGDMLVKMPESETTLRFHGPFVRLEDIAEVLVAHNEIRQMTKG